MVVDALVKKYRTGGCFAFARALHRLTGFPERCIDFGSCTHAFVLAKDGDVIDIHGKTPWKEFLSFLVREGTLPKDAVEKGLVEHGEVPGDANIYWRHCGYKIPSESAIKEAMRVAKTHPNLAGKLAPLAVDGEMAAYVQPAEDLSESARPGVIEVRPRC